jgi:hypothetical protein
MTHDPPTPTPDDADAEARHQLMYIMTPWNSPPHNTPL